MTEPSHAAEPVEPAGALEPAPLGILGVDNVFFAVGDLTEALVHYRDRLGLPVAFVITEHAMALLRIGAERPGLILRQQKPRSAVPAWLLGEQKARPAGQLWLEVPDARAAARALEQRGVTLAAPPFQIATGWTVEVADAWGNVIGLTDYSRSPQLARPSAP